MKRRFIIEQIDRRLLRTGAKSVAVFRPSGARGRTWTAARQPSNRNSRSHRAGDRGHDVVSYPLSKAGC